MRGVSKTTWLASVVVVLLAAAAVVWLGVYLKLMGLDRADKFSSAAGLVLATVALIGPIVVAVVRRLKRMSAVKVGQRLTGFRFLNGVEPPKVHEVDLRALGVKPAIEVDGPRQDEVPYIARDLDGEIQTAVRAGGFIVLHGPSAAGKTRSAAQAIAQFPDRELWIPLDTEALRSLATSAQPVANAVIWLDDIERFLHGNYLTLPVIDQLCPRARDDVVIIGTIRDEELAHFDSALGSDVTRGLVIEHPATSVLRQARSVLAMPSTLSPTEKDRAEALRADPRIDLAMGDSPDELTEYLAAGPQLLRRWIGGAATPTGRIGSAIIAVAVDYQRAGYRRALTRYQLEKSYRHYLQEGFRYLPDLPSFAEGLTWACQPIYNASACLVTRQDNGYSAHDYLIDRVDKARSVPGHIWESVLAEVPAREVLDVGIAAFGAGMIDIASRAFLSAEAAPPNDTTSVMNLSYIDDIAPQMYEILSAIEGERWLLRAAKSNNPNALFEMGRREFRKGDYEAAKGWFEKAAATGSSAAIYGLGAIQLRLGSREGAEQLWRTAGARKDANAMYNLGVLLKEHGNTKEALTWWEKAARAGFTHAMHSLAVELHAAGDQDVAHRWWSRAALLHHAVSQYNLGVLSARNGDFKEAEGWWKQAAEAGHPAAVAALARLPTLRGQLDDLAQ